MQRAIAHYLTPEMVLLGMIEAVLSFGAIYAMISTTGTSALLPGVINALPQDGILFAVTLTLVTGATSLTIGLYRSDVYLDRKRLIITSGLAAAIAFVILLAVSGFETIALSRGNAVFYAKTLAAWLVVMTLTRVSYGMATGQTALVRRVLLIGEPGQIEMLKGRLTSRRGSTFDPVALPTLDIGWALLRQHRVWGVVVAPNLPSLAVAGLLDCKLRGMKILGTAAFLENYLGRIDPDTLVAEDLLIAQGFAASKRGATLKRLSDIVICLVMLVLTLPLMALTALAIKIDSPGPIFYRQQRIGQFDRPFTLCKFRSMTADAEASGRPRWAQKQDPRITRVGRFMRETRVDELPQLVNVLRGDMSLVGPRPERPHFVEQLDQAIPFYRHRAYVKPGVTGWAQVNFPYGASVEDAREKLAYDLYYVKNRSFLLDVMILLSTVRVVLFREGAR